MSEFDQGRRDLIFGGAGALMLLLSGCVADYPKSSTPIVPTPDVYRGPVEGLNGKILLGRARLNGILDALDQTKYPFFQKLVVDLRTVTTKGGRLEGLPTWVNRDTFPLAITQSNEGATSYAHFSPSWNEDQVGDFKFVEPGEEPIDGWEFDKLNMGIHLATPSNVRERGRIAEGFYLLKEYVGLMCGIRMGLEFYDTIRNFNLGTFSEINGQPITDRDRLKRLGRAAFFAFAGNPESDTWKVLDSLPAFLVAPGVEHAVSRGNLTNNSRGVGFFFQTIGIFQENRVAYDTIVDFINRWVKEDGLLPPAGITDKSFGEPLFAPLWTLNRRMYRT